MLSLHPLTFNDVSSPLYNVTNAINTQEILLMYFILIFPEVCGGLARPKPINALNWGAHYTARLFYIGYYISLL